MAKFLDSTGANYLWLRIKEMFVAKEEGKGLSTNDYTTEEKEKLASITTGGGGGVADSVSWENVIGKPTKVSQFENDVNYQTQTQVNTAITTAKEDCLLKESALTVEEINALCV